MSESSDNNSEDGSYNGDTSSSISSPVLVDLTQYPFMRQSVATLLDSDDDTSTSDPRCCDHCSEMENMSSDHPAYEFVMRKMEDRPPRYEDIENDRIISTNVPDAIPIANSCDEPPPSYDAIHYDAPRPGSLLQSTPLNLSMSRGIDMVRPNRSTVAEAVWSNDSTVAEMVRPNRSTVAEAVRRNRSTVAEAVRRNRSTVAETVWPNRSTVAADMVRRNRSTVADTVRPYRSTVAEAYWSNNSIVAETVWPNRSTVAKMVRRNRSTVAEMVRPNRSTVAEVVRPNDSTVAEVVRPNDSTVAEVVRPNDSTVAEVTTMTTSDVVTRRANQESITRAQAIYSNCEFTRRNHPTFTTFYQRPKMTTAVTGIGNTDEEIAQTDEYMRELLSSIRQLEFSEDPTRIDELRNLITKELLHENEP